MANAGTSDTGGFSTKIVFGLIGVGLVLFLAALLVSLSPQETLSKKDRYGAGMLSKSVLGYAGIARFLERSGFQIVRERYAAQVDRRNRANIIHVITEPVIGASKQRRAHFNQRIKQSTVVVILPKRYPGRVGAKGWLRTVGQYSEKVALSPLQILDQNAVLVESSNPLRTPDGKVILAKSETPRQLFRSKSFIPQIGNDDGLLVGLLRGNRRDLWLVSDPDLLNNYDFKNKGHIAAIEYLVNKFPEDTLVVFDETRAGSIQPPREFLQILLQAPLYYVLIYAVLVLLVALWAAAPRFGPIVRASTDTRHAGKSSLIGAAAGLLRLAGQDSEIIRRYLGASLRDVARRNHAPDTLDDTGLVAWLDRVGQARQATRPDELAQMVDRVNHQIKARQKLELLREAGRIHNWKRRMIHGS